MQGDFAFSGFLLVYFGSMVASFQGLIPVHSFEVWSLDLLISTSSFMGAHLEIPLFFSCLYLVLCYFGIRYFATREAYDLKVPLAAWSAFLAVFSWMGSIRTVPVVVEIVRTRGYRHLICGDTRLEWVMDNPAAFWVFAFCLSKIPELLDTAFIVVRKRELITLHWYHHVTVLLFCWQSWVLVSLPGLVFAAMNLSVHTVMYTFYAFTSMGIRPIRFAMLITLVQIAQMLVGTLVTGFLTWEWVQSGKAPYFTLALPPWFTHKQEILGADCMSIVSSGNMLCGFVMYLSYLFLFVAFFVQAYCSRKGGKKKKKNE